MYFIGFLSWIVNVFSTADYRNDLIVWSQIRKKAHKKQRNQGKSTEQLRIIHRQQDQEKLLEQLRHTFHLVLVFSLQLTIIKRIVQQPWRLNIGKRNPVTRLAFLQAKLHFRLYLHPAVSAWKLHNSISLHKVPHLIDSKWRPNFIFTKL